MWGARPHFDWPGVCDEAMHCFMSARVAGLESLDDVQQREGRYCLCLEYTNIVPLLYVFVVLMSSQFALKYSKLPSRVFIA